MDAETLNSLRFEQNLYEGGKKRQRKYDIFPEARCSIRKERKSASPCPIRSTMHRFSSSCERSRSKSDKEYKFEKYYNPDANPSSSRCCGKDTVTCPRAAFPR